MSSGELSFMIWQPNQIPPPRATPIPNGTWNKYKDPIVEWHRNGRTQREIGILLEEKGLRCTSDQLFKQMNQVWGLKVQSRGSITPNSSNVPSHETAAAGYDSFVDDEYNSASFATSEPAPRTDERLTSYASAPSLRKLNRRQSQKSFAVGVVFAILGEIDYANAQIKSNSWVVVSLEENYFFCIRIKTYGGQGIVHLKGKDERDITAHTIIHVRGQAVSKRPEEPDMKKRSLEVELAAGIDNSVLKPTSRVCFMRHERMSYDIEAVVIGKLTGFSVDLLEIYYENELKGDNNK